MKDKELRKAVKDLAKHVGGRLYGCDGYNISEPVEVASGLNFFTAGEPLRAEIAGVQGKLANDLKGLEATIRRQEKVIATLLEHLGLSVESYEAGMQVVDHNPRRRK